MFKNIKIANFKSIDDVELNLGRVNVFIGENGAGKSNVLEAIALAGAACAGKLDSEFLTTRGIRVTQPEFMRSAFDRAKKSNSIRIELTTVTSKKKIISLENDNKPYSQWREVVQSVDDQKSQLARLNFLKNSDEIFHERINLINENISQLKARKKQLNKGYGLRGNNSFVKLAQKNELPKIDANIGRLMSERETIQEYDLRFKNEVRQHLQDMIVSIEKKIKEQNLGDDFDHNELVNLRNFIVFSPENSALRMFQREGQIEPLGINGEGLLKLLSVLSDSKDVKSILAIKENLSILSWFKNFEVIPQNDGLNRRIELEDNFIENGYKYFDQKSANEGFLFLLFYFALFSTKLTPSFFAIDNIDASLNPKLCKRLMELLVDLAKKNDKQVLLTTHNPAILDGLDLNDPDQCLFVVSRNSDGFTKVKNIRKPQIVGGSAPLMKISEMFYRGMIGGLPKGF